MELGFEGSLIHYLKDNIEYQAKEYSQETIKVFGKRWAHPQLFLICKTFLEKLNFGVR